MKLLYAKAWNKSLEKILSRQDVLKKLEQVKKILIMEESFANLKNNVVAKQYEFEKLKHELKGYSSFRLNDRKIRLIVSKGEEKNGSSNYTVNTVILNIISMDHYKDLKNKNFAYEGEV